jgi:hypothetical protein
MPSFSRDHCVLPESDSSQLRQSPISPFARGPGGRGLRKQGEESPGSMEPRCRVTPGGLPSFGDGSSGIVPQKGFRPASDG